MAKTCVDIVRDLRAEYEKTLRIYETWLKSKNKGYQHSTGEFRKTAVKDLKIKIAEIDKALKGGECAEESKRSH